MAHRNMSQAGNSPSTQGSAIIMRSDDLRAENRHRVLKALRSEGSLNRAQVGQLTGLSQAALSSLVGAMAEQGVVLSTPAASSESRRGRPQSTIELNSAAALVATISLTIDRVLVSLANYAGQVSLQTEHHIESQSLSGRKLVEAIGDAIDEALAVADETRLQHISVGFQGVTDTINGALLWSPILSVGHVPIAAALGERFDVSVAVNNDCLLIAKALHRTRKDQLGNSFATILLSHGVGMGLFLSGESFTGTRSSALELGHIEYIEGGALCRCGKFGCIEAYAADYGIWRSAHGLDQHEKPVGFITDDQLLSLCELAHQGDKRCLAAFARAGSAIGSGLGNIFNLFDSMPVALVGQCSLVFDFMREDILATLKRSSRASLNLSNMIHSYTDGDKLLHEGLLLDAMSSMDRRIAKFGPQRLEA